jgi:DNA gyrase/topoisomerase IV subunit A
VKELSQPKEVVVRKISLVTIITFSVFLCASAIGGDLYHWVDKDGVIHISKNPPPPGVEIKEIIKVPKKQPENKPDITEQIDIQMQEALAKRRERLEKAIKKIKKDIKSVEKRLEDDKAHIEFQKENLNKAKKTTGKWRKTNIRTFETNLQITKNNLKNHEDLMRDLKGNLADAEERLREISY